MMKNPSDKSDIFCDCTFRKEPAMKHKTSVFCLIFLMICGLARTQTLLEVYYAELSKKDTVKPIDVCFKIKSPTPGVSMELLFGTCASGGISEANTSLPPGTVDGSNPVDFYILHSSQAWNVFFTANRQAAEWVLVVRTPCVLNFTLLGGAAPGEGGYLKLFNGVNELLNIVGGANSGALATGQYTIKYVPAPEKSTVFADVTFTFQPGWNLLHLPIVVYSDQRREGDNWDTLKNLSMTLSGKTYVKGGDIRCGEAFWVFYKDGDVGGNTLKVLGYVPLAKDWPARFPGWNFTGEKTNTNAVADNTYEWAGRYQIPSTIDAKKGYWINTTP